MDSKENIPAKEQPLPGSQMLRNGRHEAFARARAILVPLLEAAREAGYSTMTPGNAAKIDRSPKDPPFIRQSQVGVIMSPGQAKALAYWLMGQVDQMEKKRRGEAE